MLSVTVAVTTSDVIVSLLGDCKVDSVAGVIGVIALYVTDVVRLSFIATESVPVTSLPCDDVIMSHAAVGRPDDVMTLLVLSRLCESAAAVVVVDEVTVAGVMTSLTPIIIDDASSSVVNVDVIGDVNVAVVPVSATPVDQHLHYSSPLS